MRSIQKRLATLFGVIAVFSHLDGERPRTFQPNWERRIQAGELRSPKPKEDAVLLTRELRRVREGPGGAMGQPLARPGPILQLRGEADPGGSWD
jgi:hypothetical protein